jgi:hypothetical protein
LSAQSSEEAEIIAANESIRSLLWLRNILIELSLGFDKPIMYEDDVRALRWMTENSHTMKTNTTK